MTTLYRLGTTLVVALSMLTFGAAVHSQQQTVDEIIEDITRDVVGQAIESASRKVLENTGIDIEVRGYRRDRRHRSLPEGARDETRRELRQLAQEHDRTIRQLEDELRRKLEKARAEFAREAAKDEKPEKVRDKRHKLQEKVDAAYATFDEKVDSENARFDEKRDQIVSKN